jgi:chromate transporter
MNSASATLDAKPTGPALEVLRAFFILGLTSFGGPVAHLGYFRRELVEKRGWMSVEEYAETLALCQFLPGPASSQLGFCLGLKRGGALGGLAAWVGFTLPSALLMVIIAHFTGALQAGPARGALHGLEMAALAVVAQAVWLMARSLCPDTPRRAIALLTLAILALFPDTSGQLIVLALGAVLGRLAIAPPPQPDTPENWRKPAYHAPLGLLGAYLALLALAFLLPAWFATGPLALAAAFYRAGALVFGGGHVVLPLLRDAVVVPGWVSPQNFLAGYGAAQAMPGPLFTFAAYLGMVANGLPGAAIALAAIFLPGLLLVGGAMPFWRQFRAARGIAPAMMGVNAAVVGLLGAALINLASTAAPQSVLDFALAGGAFVALTVGRARPILVVACCAAVGAVA